MRRLPDAKWSVVMEGGDVIMVSEWVRFCNTF